MITRVATRGATSRVRKFALFAAAAATVVLSVGLVRMFERPELEVTALGRELSLGEWIAAPAGGVPRT